MSEILTKTLNVPEPYRKTFIRSFASYVSVTLYTIYITAALYIFVYEGSARSVDNTGRHALRFVDFSPFIKIQSLK